MVNHEMRQHGNSGDQQQHGNDRKDRGSADPIKRCQYDRQHNPERSEPHQFAGCRKDKTSGSTAWWSQAGCEKLGGFIQHIEHVQQRQDLR